MKNLIIVFNFLLTLLIVGCADKGVYVGEKKDGKRHGQGTLTFSDGRKNSGKWLNGQLNGEVDIFLKDGSRYLIPPKLFI